MKLGSNGQILDTETLSEGESILLNFGPFSRGKKPALDLI